LIAMSQRIALVIVIAALGLPFWWFETNNVTNRNDETTQGQVVDDRGPVTGAIVRIKGTSPFVESDSEGRFTLLNSLGGRVTAWKEGYFIAGSPARNPTIRLQALPTEDSEAYAWVDPTPDPSRPANCGNCHAAIFDEWNRGGHAHAATNRRFRNLVEGTDWHGRSGVGWNLTKDHPSGVSVCASCHDPGKVATLFSNNKTLHAPHGVHCDFCHKIQGPGAGEFGLTHGKYQLSLLRPSSAKHQLFFGPLDDVDRGDDVFSPFQKDSKLCAACHEGVVFGVPVYTTYSEWLASPAARSGISCQKCHMAPTGRMTNIAPGHGGIRRNPATLGNHLFFDGSQIDMLRRSLELESTVRRLGGAIEIDIALTARNVGHRVPTGFIDRQVILFVEGIQNDHPITALHGPRLPDMLGKEEAGRSGKVYAKMLPTSKGLAPTPFWNADPAALIDSRLKPGETDRFTIRFPSGVERITLRLVHRRFWKTIAGEKGWPGDEQNIIERTLFPPRL